MDRTLTIKRYLGAGIYNRSLPPHCKNSQSKMEPASISVSETGSANYLSILFEKAFQIEILL